MLPGVTVPQDDLVTVLSHRLTTMRAEISAFRAGRAADGYALWSWWEDSTKRDRPCRRSTLGT